MFDLSHENVLEMKTQVFDLRARSQISIHDFGHLGQIASLFGLSADIQMSISLLILGVGRSNFTGRGSLASVFGKLIYFLCILTIFKIFFVRVTLNHHSIHFWRISVDFRSVLSILIC